MNTVFAEEITVEWKKDPDKLDGFDREVEIQIKWDELFHERTSGFSNSSQESFEPTIFKSNPRDLAKIYVQKHVIGIHQEENFNNFLRLSRSRKGIVGSEEIKNIISALSKFKDYDDETKAEILTKIFWIIGFETVNLEKLKNLAEYKELNNIPHVDFFAYLFSEKILVAIDEGDINKESKSRLLFR